MEKVLRLSFNTLNDAFKILEVLSYFGDDLNTLDILHELEERGIEITPSPRNALLFHLGAVSCCKLGKEDEARRQWKTALQFSPGFNLADGNLKDMDNKVGNRHAPWAYTIN